MLRSMLPMVTRYLRPWSVVSNCSTSGFSVSMRSARPIAVSSTGPNAQAQLHPAVTSARYMSSP